jgi:hypothetical protein
MPNSNAPDSCHLSLQELTVPIKSGNRTSRFNVHGFIALANPDSPMHDGMGSGAPAGLNPRSSYRNLTIHVVRETLPTIPSRRFSSSMKSSLLRHLAPVRPLLNQFLQRTERVFPLRVLEHTPCAQSSTTSQVLKLSGFCALTLATASSHSSSQAATENSNSTCTHLHGSNTQPNSGGKRDKSSTT